MFKENYTKRLLMFIFIVGLLTILHPLDLEASKINISPDFGSGTSQKVKYSVTLIDTDTKVDIMGWPASYEGRVGEKINKVAQKTVKPTFGPNKGITYELIGEANKSIVRSQIHLKIL